MRFLPRWIQDLGKKPVDAGTEAIKQLEELAIIMRATSASVVEEHRLLREDLQSNDRNH